MLMALIAFLATLEGQTSTRTAFVPELRSGLPAYLFQINQEPSTKDAVPDSAAIAKADKEIKDIFKAGFASKKSAEQLKLSLSLLANAKETKELPAKYALYSNARDLAIKAGDLAQALKTIDEMANVFAVDRASLTVDAFTSFLRMPLTPAVSRQTAELALSVVEDFMADINFDEATKLLKLADAAAKKSKSTTLANSIHAKISEVAAIAKEFEVAKVDAEILAKDPKDGEANSAYGQFLCLRKGDWAGGLKLMVQGSNEKLKELAKKELADPMEPAEQADLGDAWMKYAAGIEGAQKVPAQMRAYYWYRLAKPKLAGLSKTKVEKAIASLPREYLVDMAEFELREGPWKFSKGKTGAPDGSPILVNGKESPLSLGMHPPKDGQASVKYNLDKSAKSFKSMVGLSDQSPGSLTPLTFSVLGDGKTLWTSRPLNKNHVYQPVNVGTVGVKVLELRVNCPGRLEGAYAIWVEPYISK